MNYSEKLRDPRWQKKRLEVLESDNWTCQWCGDSDSTLHVHHFYYPKSRNPWDVDRSGLITLCESCHYIKHNISLPPVLEDIMCILHIDPIKNKEISMMINEYILVHYKKVKK